MGQPWLQELKKEENVLVTIATHLVCLFSQTFLPSKPSLSKHILFCFCRESQSLLQNEKDSLQTRCQALEEALQHKQEELLSQLTQQQQISQYWRGRWEEVTANLKTKQEEREKAPLQDETPPAKVWDSGWDFFLKRCHLFSYLAAMSLINNIAQRAEIKLLG